MLLHHIIEGFDVEVLPYHLDIFRRHVVTLLPQQPLHVAARLLHAYPETTAVVNVAPPHVVRIFCVLPGRARL